MAFENLPGVFSEKVDGGLDIFQPQVAPQTVVLGTSAKGAADELVRVVRTSDIVAQFGLDGTLARGMYEVKDGGAANVRVYRMGATSAKAEGVGNSAYAASGDPGYIIETSDKDDTAGTLYNVHFDPTTNGTAGLLKVWRNSDDFLVYSNEAGNEIDTLDVIVSGSLLGGTTTDTGIGTNTPAGAIPLEDIAKDSIAAYTNTAAEVLAIGTYTTPYTTLPALANIPVGDSPGVPVTFAGTDSTAFVTEVATIAEVLAAGDYNINYTTGVITVFGDYSVAIDATVGYYHTYAPFVVSTAGTDGTNPCKMEQYENLFNAYRALENERVDMVVPMDVYLDDNNVVDLTAGQITTLDLASLADYPTAGSEQDVLGKLFTEEYLGETYFYWDTDGDGEANIFPSVGSASATTSIDGSDITDSFIEVNFAYQLANFCFKMSVNNNECIGVIGTLPPQSFGPRDIARWVGDLPNYTVLDDGTSIINDAGDNGSGLLGNKFMGGSAGYRGGDAFGGFIATDSGNLGGSELTDRNNELVDIGKYLSIVPSYVRLANQWTTNVNGYLTNGAPSYAGFIMSLDSKSAPTNKVIPRVRAIHGLNNTVLDDLAGVKYVMLATRPKGTVVVDAPTAARQSSDYNRLSTVRIVKESIDVVRSVADPFVGEANTAQRRAALETAVDAGLGILQRQGYLQDFQLTVSSTPAQQVQGDATIELVLVPAFELRQITIVLSLSALL